MNDLYFPARIRRMPRRLLALLVALPLLLSGLLVAGQVAASAHTSRITGTAICDTATGTFSVNWVGKTDSVPADRVATVTTTGKTPAASSVPGTVVTNLAPNANYTFTQTGIPGTATIATVAVHIVWTTPGVAPPAGSFSANETGSLTLPAGCTKPLTQTIAGHIYDCVNGAVSTTERTGGTLSATGAQTVASQANPLNPTNVAAGTYTMTAGAPSGYRFVTCGSNNTASGSTDTDAVTVPAGGAGVGVFYVEPIPVITQTIAGHIYDCVNGAVSTTERTGGTLSATGAQTVASQANPLTPTNVAAGAYTMTAGAPAGYRFVTCGSNNTASGSTDTDAVTVPAGGAGVGVFYVEQIPVITQTIAGHIYDCVNGAVSTTERTGGTLSATGPNTLASQANPLTPTSVGAGSYTMTAGAPTGYRFVTCGSNNTASGSTDTDAVTVPAGGAGVGVFYVEQIPVITQTIAGHIYDCVNGATSTTERTGGTLSATGAQTVASQANPLAPTNVAAGAYTMAAGAPSGFRFVPCGSLAASITSASTATTPVAVPAGGAGVGVFYVEPIPVITQTIAGHIYDCVNGAASTTERTGGTLSATGAQTVASQANPLNPTNVAAGSYTMAAGAPSGFRFVPCGSLAASITSASTATTPVAVPAGGAGVGVFYVEPIPAITQTLTGHIYDCVGGLPTTTEQPGGTLSAVGPITAASANPLSSDVEAGTYEVTALVPEGYAFVPCTTTNSSVSPSVASQSATVPAGGTAEVVFYVQPVSQPISGGNEGPAQGPSSTPKPVVTPGSPVQGAPEAPAEALPFTGTDTAILIQLASLLVGSGLVLLVVGARRRTP